METESSKSAQPYILPKKEEPKEFELDIDVVDPHNGYPITQIDCSPKMKYVATLSEFDKSVVLWSIDSKSQSLQYENTKLIINIDVGPETSTTFTVSDNGFVAMKLRSSNPYNFGIYNLRTKTTEKSPLHFPYLHKNISHLSFINNGNLVTISTNEHKACILYPKEKDNRVKWIFKSMIELKNISASDKIFITPKGKLIFLKKETYEITIWNLEPLSIEAQILLDWNLNFECVGLSDDEELLGISASSELHVTYLYIFSTTTGMNLSKCTYRESVMIDGIHFIASDFGERILITSHVHDSLERVKMDLNVHIFHNENLNFDYGLMDPYTLMNPVSADKLFRRLKSKIKTPYIIKSDRIIYANDGQLFIEKLVKQSVKDDWINYLRNDLNDYNKISTPPGKKDILIFLKNIGSKKYIQGAETYEGYLTKWTLGCKDVTFTLEVSEEKSEVSRENKRETVHKKKQLKANMYVRKCKVLKNDDLVMVTEKCVILWTFNPLKGISVHYIWGVGKDISDEYWGKIFNDPSLPERFLPQSDFDGIIKEANIKSDKDITNLYYLLLDNYIKEKFFLARFGKILMQRFLSLNEKCFYEVHVHKLRDLINDIQNGKWATLEKPYVPPPLFLEFIYTEDESEISQIKKRLEDLTNDESEISQIKKRLEDLTNDESEIRQIKKRVDDLTSNNSEIKKRLEDLTNDESEIRQIKKRVDDLTSDNSEISQIKKGLEDLANLFVDFKDFKNEVISKLNELKPS
ncbi:12112_t:CDS:2 [Dentiscutata erythropus]|uniref:12112_t:CDS:1 n=1 Tax=Dentiscutata erythropus TaxID=1348616 RepID=A0A9N9BGI2_9GLOM|nr:12112_t:CDS:2 [Dentiscutata erythropus]